MTIYDRIKERREELGMSQQELAERLGYSARSTITKIEKGQRDIKQDTVMKFADALRVTPGYLMGWDEEAPAEKNDRRTDELIKLFKQLTPEEQQAIITVAKGMHRQDE